ncbi:MAG TPA: hypothetical protein VH880_14145 [Anaeromyxobacteraceae bacterium]|jgi:hypothetical protein
MRRSAQRGSALLMSVIVVLVITVIGVGIIRFASREVSGATAGARHESLVACADAGRRLLLSRFHALGVAPSAIEALNVTLDSTTSAARTRVIGGHIDSFDPNTVKVTQVTDLPPNAFGPTVAVRDLTNVVFKTGGGGKPMKVVVHCQDAGDGTATGGRQLEVEFGVRFGF